MLFQQLGIRKQGFCWTIGDNLPFIHDDHARKQFLDQAHVVRRNEQCYGQVAQ